MSGLGVLAHQGGWDEILMVLTPIALFAGMLFMANKRATAKLAEEAEAAAAATTDDDAPDR